MTALLEILRGRYMNGTELRSASEDDGLVLSIQDHLTLLLNARRESLPHMPEYGMPDLTDIYSNLPYSLDQLIAEVSRSIEKYEPRLRNVHVSVEPLNGASCVIHLRIEGSTVVGRTVRLRTWFYSEGRAEVN